MALLSLGDDALLEVFSFVPVFDCARASAASRALRGSTTSQALARTRGSGEYALRGRGVVHALATAFGTRPWATDQDPHYGAHPMVPRSLEVRINIEEDPDYPGHDFRESFRWKVVAQPLYAYTDGIACDPGIGCFVEYVLPFRLRAASFQIGFGTCCARSFRDWTLEAFDPEQDAATDQWRVLFDSDGEAHWADVDETGRGVIAHGPVKRFHLDAPFEARRFRICSCAEIQCFHVRAFDLFGTVLPPWRLDLSGPAPAPASAAEAISSRADDEESDADVLARIYAAAADDPRTTRFLDDHFGDG